MAMNIIAQELIDMIIVDFHDDKNTLFSTSLVCRRWLQRSLVHLFHTFRSYPDTVLTSFPNKSNFVVVGFEKHSRFLLKSNFRFVVNELNLQGGDGDTCVLRYRTLDEKLSALPWLHNIAFSYIRTDMRGESTGLC